MLDGLTAEQFIRWMAYARLEPFGEERADLRSAIIAVTMANAWRGKGSRAFKIEDFMPEFDKPPQTWQEMRANFRAWGRAHNEMEKHRG